MRPNPVLTRLGYAPDDRVVLVHADDVGMCHATVPAFFDLAEAGQVSAGSVMVPCPWSAEAAAEFRRHPSADLGVHLTLTSEWERYRWGPLAHRNSDDGLVDQDGFFFRNQSQWVRPDASAAVAEMRAQIDRAVRTGMEVTHLDCHMFAMLSHGLTDGYVDLGFGLGVPVFLTRQPAWVRILSAARLDAWEARGMPVFDHLREMPLDLPAAESPQAVKQILAELEPGLTYFILHPAIDTPELRAIAPDWRQRVGDYETFRTGAPRRFAHDAGIHWIGWRAIRDAFRAGLQ
jgi:hypothetical protein